MTRSRSKARTLDVVERIARSERSRIEVCVDESETGTFAVIRHRVRRYPSAPWFPIRTISLNAREAKLVGEALIKAAELVEDETKLDLWLMGFDEEDAS